MSTPIHLRLMALSGKFTCVAEITCPDAAAALAAVVEHANSGGYSHVQKVIDDNSEYDGFRYTARTPGGRGGRNVAFAQWIMPEGTYEPQA